jgi:hypothetical protein
LGLLDLLEIGGTGFGRSFLFAEADPISLDKASEPAIAVFNDLAIVIDVRPHDLCQLFHFLWRNMGEIVGYLLQERHKSRLLCGRE